MRCAASRKQKRSNTRWRNAYNNFSLTLKIMTKGVVDESLACISRSLKKKVSSYGIAGYITSYFTQRRFLPNVHHIYFLLVVFFFVIPIVCNFCLKKLTTLLLCSKFALSYLRDENGLLSVLKYEIDDGRLQWVPYNVPIQSLAGTPLHLLRQMLTATRTFLRMFSIGVWNILPCGCCMRWWTRLQLWAKMIIVCYSEFLVIHKNILWC